MNKQVESMLWTVIFASVSSFFISNLVCSTSSNEKDRKILAIVLAIMAGIAGSYIPTFAKTIKKKLFFWKPYLNSNELEFMFEQLTVQEKEFLFKKNLVEKDAKEDFYLKYICPITMSLMNAPTVVQVRNPNGGYALEIYEASAITKWLEQHSDLSPITKKPIEKLHFFFSLFLKKEFKDYTAKLEKEIKYLNEQRQKINAAPLACFPFS